jgi:hypothetical protein
MKMVNFFLLTMAANNNSENRRKRRAEQVLSSSDEEDVMFPRYLVVSSIDNEPIKLNIFGIHKLLSCAIGDVPEAKKLRNGSVLIQVTTKKQAEKAMAMTDWVNQEIKVSPHRSLNTSRGIIRSRELRDCSDDEVLEALSGQGVIAVRRIMFKKDDSMEPTNTIILTFGMPTPPKYVKAAYLRLDVELFIPNPLRCFNCQKYGHGKSTCNRRAVCAKCAQEGHLDDACPNSPHCANCSGHHCSYSKDCQEWGKQKEISRIKFERNIPFGEAKKIVEQNLLNNTPISNAPSARRAGVSYSQATSKIQTVSVEIQTELSWPLDSKVPVAVSNLVPTNTCDSSSQTQSDGAIGGRPKTPTETNIPHYKAVENKKQDNLKPGPASSKFRGNRPAKGSTDPIKIHNRFGSLEDNMEYEGNSSPKAKHK